MKVRHDSESCPECKASWVGDPIPEKYLHLYGHHNGHSSRLIGVNLSYDHPRHYDGVSYWQCPDCKATWNRWTGKLEAIT